MREPLLDPVNRFVSVCLPVFNGERYLARAIESVLEQGLSTFELIVVDDGSADHSASIVELYAKKDNRIHFKQNSRHLGMYANYNECMRLSTGHIKLFAQDDVLLPNSLERGVEILESNPKVLLTAANRRFIDECGEDITEYVLSLSACDYLAVGQVVSGHDVVVASLLAGDNLIGDPASVMIRRDIRLQGFNISYSQMGDLDFWLRILQNGDFYYCNEALSLKRMHSQSSTALNTRELSLVADFVRLGKNFELALVENRSSYDLYMKRNINKLADYVASLNRLNLIPNQSSNELARQPALSEELALPSSDDYEKLIFDLKSYRDLTYYALSELGVAKTTEQKFALPSLSVEEELSSLERRLTRLLTCTSWKRTRILRELNLALQVYLREKSAKFATHSDRPISVSSFDFEEPVSYKLFLRDQIKKIRLSKSWRLTKPLRKYGIF